MCDQNIKTATEKEFQTKSVYSATHFTFRILMVTWTVSHRTAKSENTNSFINIEIIVNADTSFGRSSFIFCIVISMNINNWSSRKSCQKRKVMRMQITTGNNKINSFQFSFFIKITPDCIFPNFMLYYHKITGGERKCLILH